MPEGVGFLVVLFADLIIGRALSKNQRLAVLALLSVLLGALFLFPLTSPAVGREIGSILFASLFLLSFTALLLEHFFGRPTDALAAAVSILLLIVPSRPLLESWGGWYWVLTTYEFLAVFLASAALLLLTEAKGPSSWQNKTSEILKELTIRVASGKAQYFWLFFLTLVFFVEPRSVPFIALLVYGAFVFLLEPSKLAPHLRRIARTRAPEVGNIFGVQGRNTFLVRLHAGGARPPLRVGDLLELTYGMDEPSRLRRGIVLERFFLDQAQWIRVLCHEEIDRQAEDVPLENGIVRFKNFG